VASKSSKRSRDPYLAGERLHGDDLDADGLAAWYAAEAEGYADLGPADEAAPEEYYYEAIVERHCWRHLPTDAVGDVLGIGSAFGEELARIAPVARSLTILEPSQRLRSAQIAGRPVTYVTPDPSGSMPFPDASFDLITAFGVFHHIPNVSHVFAEAARVLRPGGYFLYREPVHSMGDWTSTRRGLTARERGIPVPMVLDLAHRNGLRVVHRALYDFPTMGRLTKPNSRLGVLVDSLICRAFAWNSTYHATTTLQKLRPRGLALVMQRK
jgi:SAM-dependent methyltransferase